MPNTITRIVIESHASLFSADVTAYVIPFNKLSDVKQLSDRSIQGNYTSNIIVKGIEIDG